MFYVGKVTNKTTGVPMAGVAVSDGRNIVFTDSDGYYELPGWERSNTLCVCVLTTCHDDWFYYTGGQPGEYDFALSPAESRDFKILQTSDTEIKNRTDLQWLDFFREKIASVSPAFLIHTGDISSREGLERHCREMNFDTMGCPVRYVIGNHDFIKNDVDYGEQLYEQLYGPLWYGFDCAGIHCVVLSLGHGSKGAISGYTREDQWQWLKNELAVHRQEKPLVVFCHDHGPDAYEFVIEDIDLKKHGLVAWIYGHSHSNSHHVRSGVHIINTARPDCGGIDSSPAGIRQINVKNGQVRSLMHYSAFPIDAPDTSVWQRELPGKVTFCQMVETEEDLLVGTMRNSLPGQGGIYRINKKNGDIRWSFETRGGINTDISLDGDRVYAQDCMGWSYCLAADTGKLIWEKENHLGGNGRTMVPGFVAGQVVLAGRYTRLVALDKNTAEVAWLAPEVKRGGNTPARPVYDSQNQRLYISAQWGYLACLDAVTGQEIWRRREAYLVSYPNALP